VEEEGGGRDCYKGSKGDESSTYKKDTHG